LDYRGAAVINYVHPHIAGLSSEITDDFVSAGRSLITVGIDEPRRGRVPTWLEPAISEYETNVLQFDQPMVTALSELGISVGHE
jgi:hypothetical protein